MSFPPLSCLRPWRREARVIPSSPFHPLTLLAGCGYGGRGCGERQAGSLVMEDDHPQHAVKEFHQSCLIKHEEGEAVGQVSAGD